MVQPAVRNSAMQRGAVLCSVVHNNLQSNAQLCSTVCMKMAARCSAASQACVRSWLAACMLVCLCAQPRKSVRVCACMRACAMSVRACVRESTRACVLAVPSVCHPVARPLRQRHHACAPSKTTPSTPGQPAPVSPPPAVLCFPARCPPGPPAAGKRAESA